MEELLRSKGFVWIATTNNIMGALQQAGNIIRIEAEQPWMSEIRDMWEGTPSEELVRKDMTQKNGEELPYADRRQELVFIGIKLDHAAIQFALDKCLLNDDEMNMGPEKWKEIWADEDKIELSLEEKWDELSDEDEEDEDNDENEEGDDDSDGNEEEDAEDDEANGEDEQEEPIRKKKKISL